MAKQTLFYRIEELLSPVTVRLLHAAGAIASRAGLPLSLVGGSVRDLLLGRPPLDLDLVVEGDALWLASILATELGGAVKARSQFGTAKLQTPDLTVDLVSARRESYAYPGALPTVQPGTLADDLARRDFTINAMAADLGTETFGRLNDPFDGQADLGLRIIRVLHPKSFADDATRILRAIRYEQRLGFRMEAETEALVQQEKHYLDTISGHRVRHELERIYQEIRPEKVLARAHQLNVLAQVFPALEWPKALHGALDRWRTEGEQSQPLLFAALLAASLSPEEGASLAERLNMPARSRRIVHDTIELRSRLTSLTPVAMRLSQVARLLRDLEPTAVQAWALLTSEQRVRQQLIGYTNHLRYVKTKLTGHDIGALGVPPGPRVGQLLEDLLTARLDGLVTSRKDEEAWVRRQGQP